jgi:AAA+ ATPase superfamily predicted ATPase
MLGLDAAAALETYLVIGGFPRLASRWRKADTIWKFLERELGDPTSSLVVVGERSLNAEFPPDTHARNVLNAIGAGERAFSAIEQRAGLEQNALARPLKTLQEKRVIMKLTPYSTRRNTKAPRYVVTDPYLRFWLRFIGPNMELIQRGRGDIVLERIRASWKDYRGRAVEPLVREAIERIIADGRFGDASFVGGYWTRDNSVEVDLVGGRDVDRSDVIDFVGSIKWKETGRFGRDDLSALVAHRAEVPGATEATLLVGVSRAGFSADGLDVMLGPDDLIAAWKTREPGLA